jgi:hypothetical protein
MFGSNCTVSTPGMNDAAMLTTTSTSGAEMSKRRQTQSLPTSP